jgi:hypothetical protein
VLILFRFIAGRHALDKSMSLFTGLVFEQAGGTLAELSAPLIASIRHDSVLIIGT